MNKIRQIIADKIAELKDKRVTDYADGFNDGLIEAFKVFLELTDELVDKETPMKVIANSKLARNQYKYICPNCKKFLFSANSQVMRLISHQENYKHCAFCGQRLDWSDSE